VVGGEKGDILEATGGYQRELMAELLSHGPHVAAVNARQVRDDARALRTLAKTDEIDARVLACFGCWEGSAELCRDVQRF